MSSGLKKRNGRVLDILKIIWKTDCEKKEKRSQDRWERRKFGS